MWAETWNSLHCLSLRGEGPRKQPENATQNKTQLGRYRRLKNYAEERVGKTKIKSWGIQGLKNKSWKVEKKRPYEKLETYQSMMQEVLSSSTEFSSEERA